ncbi:hypothetical protein COHA_000024 [Chlorella ohadii]|uniref:Uncharacterized protein n=1 Tax=Chlorella ohadii TaxID=2649997 RepID=A0AAD5E1N7_9CHLO|nr:hypothetical protein COHA_000024 [Chlorella ohadii]
MTALHLAAWMGHTDAVRLLLRHGADASAEAPDGRSPLSMAAAAGRCAIVAALLESGPSLASEALLRTAVSMGARRNDILKMLLAAGAQAWGSVLIEAASLRLQLPSKVHLLLEAGRPVNSADAEGTTALHAAAAKGHASVVAVLLAAGADVHARSADGMTPLHSACGSRDPAACVTLLLRAGADPRAVTSKQHGRLTPLHLVAANSFECDASAEAALVAAGARTAALTANKETPLSLAAAHGRGPSVAFLLQQGADVNQASWDGRTPLLYAAWCGSKSVDVLRLLLEAGAVIQAVTTQTLNDSVLRSAAGYSSPTDEELISALLDAGCHSDTPASDGRTPLMAAVASGNQEVVAALLGADADLNATDSAGNTALHIAAAAEIGSYRELVVVALLLSAGAAAATANSQGQLPADVAAAQQEDALGIRSCLLREAAAHPLRQHRLATVRPRWEDSDAERCAAEAKELLKAAGELIAACGESVDRATQHPPCGDELVGGQPPPAWRAWHG